jgi:hypothetical protein
MILEAPKMTQVGTGVLCSNPVWVGRLCVRASQNYQNLFHSRVSKEVMRTKYVGEILAMLLIGGSAFGFIHLDSQGILSCLPLLLGLYAIHRGATWAAFAVLSGSAGLVAMSTVGRAPNVLLIASLSAVVPTLLVLPRLWRFDRVATPVLTIVALALGIGGALLSYPAPPPCQEPPRPEPLERVVLVDSTAFEPAVNKPPVALELPLPVPCEAADLVGIYQDQEGKKLRLSTGMGFVHFRRNASPTRGTFSIDEHEVVFTTRRGKTTRIGCSPDEDGRFTLDSHTVQEISR